MPTAAGYPGCVSWGALHQLNDLLPSGESQLHRLLLPLIWNLTGRICQFDAAKATVLTPATLAGAWVGRTVVGRISDQTFVRLVEAGLVVAGVMFLLGF